MHIQFVKEYNSQIYLVNKDNNWNNKVKSKYDLLVKLHSKFNDLGFLAKEYSNINKITPNISLFTKLGSLKAKIILLMQKYPYLKELEIAYIISCSLRWVEKVMRFLRENNFFKRIIRVGRIFVRELNLSFKNAFNKLNCRFIKMINSCCLKSLKNKQKEYLDDWDNFKLIESRNIDFEIENNEANKSTDIEEIDPWTDNI